MSIPKERSLNAKEIEFIKHTRDVCKSNKIKFTLVNRKNIIDEGAECVGYFNPEPAELVCSTKNPDFIATLVHESCHADQWLENPSLFNDEDIIFPWLQGKEFTQKQVNKAIKDTIALELDCEKRSVQKIKDFTLDINIDQYIQGANSYLMFFNLVRKVRKWYRKGSSPHQRFEIYDNMPTKFMADSYYYKLTPRMEKLYKKCKIV